MPIKIGDKLPSVQVMEGTPKDKVNVATLFSGKKGVLFAVPGAFTPGCSKEKGVEVVACISVNDPFVMAAWGEAHKCEGKAVDMELDARPFLGSVRSKRYVMVIEDGMVTALNVEPDGTGLSCSLANSILSVL
ncbi:Peroxiredoxin-5, mitochondrial [Stylophora pistillata]|uniref:Peroxiredoxin-5 n=1 Tax=Stylophora pistillata TaxID=50429 RepID=A0A2B4RF66_STYPI|nr:Peroxiredoxin-5, mitochondrial [Stylophora pistillata]